MRSATSYFNGTLYRKTMARFWPLWGLWGLIWLFALPLNMLNAYFSSYRWQATGPQEALLNQAESVHGMLTLGVMFAMSFAVLCAMAVFGYLYNHRAACWFHALPMRREALFTTQYLAGLSFLILPLVAVAILTAIVEMSFLPMEDWYVLKYLLTWLLGQSGICLFFFSFAAFCSVFTGHILALPAFYGILNFLAAGVWFLVEGLMSEFYYGFVGITGADEVITYLTPAAALDTAVRWGYGDTHDQLRSPGTVAIYAAVGVALALFSLYVYRRRHVETAGDVVAVPLVRPLFKYGVAFCAGLAFGIFTAAFFGWGGAVVLIPCIVVWTVIGYFAAEMLLKKSFRVFKAWRGGVVMGAIMLVITTACFLDVFGVVERVPDPGQVEHITAHIDMGYPSDSGRDLSGDFRDPEQIAKIIALHQAIVDNREDDLSVYHSGSDYADLHLTYHLSDGSTLRRDYNSVELYSDELETPGTVAYALSQITNDRELVALAYDFEDFTKNARLTSAYLEYLSYNGEPYYDYLYLDDYRQALWDAVQQDFAEGNIGVRYLFDNSEERRSNTYRTDLIFEVTSNYSELKSPAGYEDETYEPAAESRAMAALHITLTPQARHTLAVLDQTGIWEEGYALRTWSDDSEPGYPDTVSPVIPQTY